MICKAKQWTNAESDKYGSDHHNRGDSKTRRIQENADQHKRTSVEREKNARQYITEMDENIDKDKTWGWLKNGDLKVCKEALICAARDQSLRTNYGKHHIDSTLELPRCMLFGEQGETTINHIARKCKS